ncbi:MAG: hypothetical protein J6Y03_03635 [Alphaproteobacteria bacterium]|nr:hypothetical protein [Alphaproteobacteria bacterium]
MKKTLLILFASVSFFSVTACYTTPEMDEVRYKNDYENVEGGCSAEADYQHEGLRNCIESRMAYDDENKKTVTIITTKKDTLVIPRTYDDEAMMDTSRIYERVDINDRSVVIEDGSAPKEALPAKVEEAEESEENTTIVEVSKTSTQEETEIVKISKDDVEAVIENKVEDITTDKNESKKSSATKTETIVETEIVSAPGTKVKAEIIAEPETVVEIGEKKGNVEVKETVAVSKTMSIESGTITREINPDVTVVVKAANEEITEEKPAQTDEKIKTFEKNEKEVLPIEEK